MKLAGLETAAEACPVPLPAQSNGDQAMDDVVDVSRIRALNDALRRSLTGGVLMMTRGVIALGLAHQLRIDAPITVKRQA